MKVKELIQLLRQFDPERNVWVIYDSFEAFPASFAPMSKEEAQLPTCYWEETQPAAGDLATYAG